MPHHDTPNVSTITPEQLALLLKIMAKADDLAEAVAVRVYASGFEYAIALDPQEF